MYQILIIFAQQLDKNNGNQKVNRQTNAASAEKDRILEGKRWKRDRSIYVCHKLGKEEAVQCLMTNPAIV